MGVPNVGKSTIVRSISSATPEVNNYPFTTRGMTLGHVEVFWQSVVDAPASASGSAIDGDGDDSTDSKIPSSLYEISRAVVPPQNEDP